MEDPGGLSQVKMEDEHVMDNGGLRHMKMEHEYVMDNGLTESKLNIENKSVEAGKFSACEVFIKQEPIEEMLDNYFKEEEENLEDAGYEELALKTEQKELQSNERTHVCPQCDYSTVSPIYLRIHIRRIHLRKITYYSKDNTHRCLYCTYTTPNASDLEFHKSFLHSTKEKPHKCPYCAFCTKNAPVLNKHLRVVHCNGKPLKCPHCDYEHVTAYTLRRHIKFNHYREIKIYNCPSCKFSTKNINVLIRHVRSVHKDENFDI